MFLSDDDFDVDSLMASNKLKGKNDEPFEQKYLWGSKKSVSNDNIPRSIHFPNIIDKSMLHINNFDYDMLNTDLDDDEAYKRNSQVHSLDYLLSSSKFKVATDVVPSGSLFFKNDNDKINNYDIHKRAYSLNQLQLHEKDHEMQRLNTFRNNNNSTLNFKNLNFNASLMSNYKGSILSQIKDYFGVLAPEKFKIIKTLSQFKTGIKFKSYPIGVFQFSIVLFKNGRIDVFALPNHLLLNLLDLVIVEADRGYDLGKYVKVISESEAIFIKSKILDSNINVEFPKSIIRVAEIAELKGLLTKSLEEEKALELCWEKSKNLGLKMEFIDAELQSDRNKCTFYYESAERIDFRELVKFLFKIYKVRIWMEKATIW